MTRSKGNSRQSRRSGHTSNRADIIREAKNTKSTHVSTVSGEHSRTRASSVTSSTLPKSSNRRTRFQIRVPTPVPLSPSQPISARSLDLESFGSLVNSMHQEMASVCETTGETLGFGNLSAEGDDGNTEVAVTLCQLAPGKLSGYITILQNRIHLTATLPFASASAQLAAIL